MTAVIIDVGELRKVKSRSEGFLGSVPNYSLDISGQKITFRDLTVEGEATNTGEGIYVRGKITGEVSLICSLCLKNFSVNLDVPFAENFYRVGEDIPQDMKDEPLQFYSGEEIDLSGIIREALQLMLPMKPVCRSECRGLCSQCGCDLNIQQCSCRREEIDPRLAVLGQLIEDQNKNSK
ncbi:MAG: DUF177 domain-containing protein [Syntrophaceticus schinkii]|nr:DUF177 domain-containing protein [Syntrophaceticus schinkii]